MQPLFYHSGDGDLQADSLLKLPEETARHLVQVLRKTAGFSFFLADGKGLRAEMILEETGKKSALARVEAVTNISPPTPRLTLAVAFTKAAARNEWLLEKATELGVTCIVPLLTKRSEMGHFRAERWKTILVSAMQQSQQCWLPQLGEPVRIESFLKEVTEESRFIAHCINAAPRQPFSQILQQGENATLLIGPEGDFTTEEVAAALEANFSAVTLGATRLRTETAAMAGMAYFRLLNDDPDA